MENNNSSSNSSVCTKIRQAFASSSSLRAIQRILSLNQEQKHVTNGLNYPLKANSVQTKPHHKAQTETSSDAIPIKFDYSTPTYKQNGNSSAVSSVAKDASTHVGNSERTTKVSAKSELPQARHVPKKAVAQNGTNQHGKESVNIITSKEFIERVIGRGQNNPAAAPDHEVHDGTTTGSESESLEDDFMSNIHRTKIRRDKKVDENHNNSSSNSERATKVSAKSELPQAQHVPKKAVAQNGTNQHGKESVDINDTFKEFIQRAKKKIRTVSNIGRGQNNPAAAPDHEVHHGTTTSGKNESLEDHFQDFIHRAKKKIRTTTMVGKTGSMRRN